MVLTASLVCGLQPKTAKYPRDAVYIRNPDIQDGVDDLTALSYMHDPAILHAVLFAIESNSLKCSLI